jgi:uroporphyrinogen decarboxylase
VDRPAVAFWRHWPVDDQDAEALTRAQFDFQRKYDWDFIKVTPSHTYCIDDYGARHVYRGIPIGDRDHVKRVITRLEDWDRIQPLDVRKGAYARQLRCLELVLRGRDPNTPVIQTIFNPLAMAKFLADEVYLVHLRQDPKRVERALGALAETCAAFAKAVIAAGADGIFLSTSAASYEAMSEDEYRRFGRPGDLKVLEAAGGGWLNILHLHGQHPMLAAVVAYPVQGLNWHDRAAGPSLTDAAKLFPGALVGGVEQFTLLHFGTPAEVKAQVRDAIAQTNGRRLIVAAGCTYPLTVPEGNLLAARQAVEEAVAGC